MTQVSLKAIFTLDAKTKTFSAAAHNLTGQKAAEKTAALETKGRNVKVLDQPSRHKGRGFKSCELCRSAAENLSQKPHPDPGILESPEDTAVREDD